MAELLHYCSQQLPGGSGGASVPLGQSAAATPEAVRSMWFRWLHRQPASAFESTNAWPTPPPGPPSAVETSGSPPAELPPLDQLPPETGHWTLVWNADHYYWVRTSAGVADWELDVGPVMGGGYWVNGEGRCGAVPATTPQ
ncbi:MAG: hypothetical protein ACYDAQ_18845 [Mycobacteriales bacterium]